MIENIKGATLHEREKAMEIEILGFLKNPTSA